jgi:uncharacterized protein YyaL (SSP411 family)
MLYDNALLVDLLCEVYRETSNRLYAMRIDETVGWLLREMVAQGLRPAPEVKLALFALGFETRL